MRQPSSPSRPAAVEPRTESRAESRIESHLEPHVDADMEARDLQAYAAFASGQDTIDLEAATWLARCRAGLSEEEAAQLRAWRARDVQHARAFDELQVILGSLSPASSSRADAPQSPARRAWMRGAASALPRTATLGLALSTLGGGWAAYRYWQAQPSFSLAYATGRGQLRNIDLPDGSRIEMDTQSQLHVRLYRDRRLVELRAGQAMFSVSADPERPFHVSAGQTLASVVGTRFSMRHGLPEPDAALTRITVEEGRVLVRHAAPSNNPSDNSADPPNGIPLQADESLAAYADGQFSAIAHVARGDIAPWRSGRLSFDNAPLSQVLAEFERYGDTGLTITDPLVGALRLGGSFNLRHLEDFRQTLVALLPVRLEQVAGKTRITHK